MTANLRRSIPDHVTAGFLGEQVLEQTMPVEEAEEVGQQGMEEVFYPLGAGDNEEGSYAEVKQEEAHS